MDVQNTLVDKISSYLGKTSSESNPYIFLVNLGDQERTCAKDIHENCAKELVAKTPEHDLCSSVLKFVECYQNRVGVQPAVLPASCKGHHVAPEISRTFNEVIQYFSNYLVGLYRDDDQASVMCKVHQGDLEGDCLVD